MHKPMTIWYLVKVDTGTKVRLAWTDNPSCVEHNTKTFQESVDKRPGYRLEVVVS